MWACVCVSACLYTYIGQVCGNKRHLDRKAAGRWSNNDPQKSLQVSLHFSWRVEGSKAVTLGCSKRTHALAPYTHTHTHKYTYTYIQTHTHTLGWSKYTHSLDTHTHTRTHTHTHAHLTFMNVTRQEKNEAWRDSFLQDPESHQRRDVTHLHVTWLTRLIHMWHLWTYMTHSSWLTRLIRMWHLWT